MVGEFLKGNFRVRAIRPAFSDVYRLCDNWSENAEIRRHSLKLRYWPDNHPEDESGQLLDLDWSWIKSMPGMDVGELRVHDTIGGNDNLRIIFYVGDKKICEPLPMIWVIRVIQKARDDFSKHDITTFKARRLLVIERFYKPRQ